MVDVFNATTILSIFESNMYFQRLSSLIGRTYIDLFVFTLALFVYAFFIWQFYRRLAKRDLFELDMYKHEILPDSNMKTMKKVFSGMAYVLKYLILFPLYVAFWFAVLSLFLFILAQEVAVRQIIFISVILISSIRMTSYYKEELASDLAKLVPFVFLGILLTQPTFFSFNLFYERLQEIPNLTSVIIEFLAFTIVFEWIVRLLYSINRKIMERVATQSK